MTNYRKILFPYAYNILGSSEDAKDAIQEVLARYYTTPKAEVQNEKNYLIRGVINQAVNQKNKKKKFVDQEVWLPEPVATEEADTNLNLNEIVSYSLLVLLEQLNPKERAVFILREGFAYSHEEIAEVLVITVENARKLLSRAKSKLNAFQQERSSRPPLNLPPQPSVPSGLLQKYIEAIRARDTGTLEDLLASDVAFFADGGKQVNTVAKSCLGASAVAELLVYIYDRFQTSYTAVATLVNHQPALLYYETGELKACQVFTLDAINGRIRQIDTVLDPDKLKNFSKHSF